METSYKLCWFGEICISKWTV